MHIEIDETIKVVSRFIMEKFEPSQLKTFQQKLYDILIVKYCSSWDLDNPYRGTGNRVIIGGFSPRDKVLVQACKEAAIPVDSVIRLLPQELYIFTNPGEVCYRIGDEGSIHDTYNANKTVEFPKELEGMPKAEAKPMPQTITIVKRMTPEDERSMPPALYFQMMVQQLAND